MTAALRRTSPLCVGGRPFKRARASGVNLGKIVGGIVWFYCSFKFENVHPLEAGFVRYKFRRDRRPTLPIESPLLFYPRYVANFIYKNLMTLKVALEYNRVRKRLERDPSTTQYVDEALTPVTDSEIEVLEIFSVTQAAQEAVVRETRSKRSRKRRASATG